MFERFTDRARRVLVLAQEEARRLNHNHIGTEHILLGLIREGEGPAAQAFKALNISLEMVRQRVEETIGPVAEAAPPAGSPPFTPRSKKVLELALREALQLGHNYVGTEHLLLGLAREGEGLAAQVLDDLGAPLPAIRVQVVSLLSGHQSAASATERRSQPEPPNTSGGWVAGFSWPMHPEKIVAGPGKLLRPGRDQVRLIGALFFESGFELMWRTFEHESEPRGRPIGALEVRDDSETEYLCVQVRKEGRGRGEVAIRAFFTPAVPESAHRLEISWTELAIEIEL